MSRKNILFIMADQMAAPLLPIYGPSPIKLPHLSRLAAQGVVFDAAYCNSPLCAPSRFTLVSGQLPSKIGAYDNAADLPADVPTYAHYLRRLGYRTALAGKMHFCGPDQLHGYEERLTSDIYPADYGWSVNWDEPDARPSWYHNMASVLQAGPGSGHGRGSMTTQPRQQGHSRPANGATRGKQGQPAVTGHAVPPPRF